MTFQKTNTIMAVSSPGGHWNELQELADAFESLNVVYASPGIEVGRTEAQAVYHPVKDCTRKTPISALLCLLKLAFLYMRYRPRVVFTTGSLPGYFAVRIGAIFGSKTIWLESIANCEGLSMSGAKARPYCSIFLSQWPYVADQQGALYRGSLL